GSVLELRMETTAPARANTAGAGVRYAPYGLFGAAEGTTHRYRLLSEGRAEALKTKAVGVPVHPGDVFLRESSGAGGAGPPGLLAGALGQDVAALLGQTERVVHGTTVATNALLERKGARVGLLTTAGHRDVIEMREGLKDDRYNLRMPPPVPLVPRARRLGVRE